MSDLVGNPNDRFSLDAAHFSSEEDINVLNEIMLIHPCTVRATKSGRDLPLGRKSLLLKTGDR